MRGECPIVQISLGKTKGKVLEKVECGKTVYLYTSLPFAKPPIGDLRFELPVSSPDRWEGTHDASRNSAAPLQDENIMKYVLGYLPLIAQENPTTYSEDCLYLSVYTSNPSSTANLPVLFWIYGGEFIMGGESFYDARVIASLHDVVVVIPNYRLNVFGFLSLGRHTEYSGNIGLHDQVMALKWTQSHIQAFGGNPGNVTIFGESAGSMSVSSHVVSPLSTGLFHRAIMHSGTFYNLGFPHDSGDVTCQALLKYLSITENKPESVIKALKSLPAEELLEASKVLRKSHINFDLVFDGNFFPKHPSIMRKEPACNRHVPLIIGCNSTEGFGIMNPDSLQNYQSDITKEAYETGLKNYIAPNFCAGLPEAGFEAITKEYENGKQEEDKMKWTKVYGEVLADAIFIIPSLRAIKQHVGTKGKSFMYVMTQQLRLNHDPTFGPESARKPEFCECDHVDDVVFTFGIPLAKEKLTIDAKFTEEEKNLSLEWMKYLVNFASNGDPNSGAVTQTKWAEYDLESQEYLSVQQPFSLRINYQEKAFEFWNKVIEPMRITSDQSHTF